jgi:murein L,D-transpeptidase YafK
MLRSRFFLSSLAIFFIVIAALFFWLRPQAVAAPEMVAEDQQIDGIIIEKAKREMSLFRQGQLIKSYNIRLGFAPEGHKTREGDGKTPEGDYLINRRNPRSKFHLSLGLDYPLPAQKANAKANGINPGGDIFIHGQPNWMAKLPALTHDWTDGCVALTNQEIEEIWRLVPIGTKVSIRP